MHWTKGSIKFKTTNNHQHKNHTEVSISTSVVLSICFWCRFCIYQATMPHSIRKIYSIHTSLTGWELNINLQHHGMKKCQKTNLKIILEVETIEKTILCNCNIIFQMATHFPYSLVEYERVRLYNSSKTTKKMEKKCEK